MLYFFSCQYRSHSFIVCRRVKVEEIKVSLAFQMSRSMEDDFTYFVKILDENGDRFYLKSSIDERTNTILIQLTNLELGWSGARKSVAEPFSTTLNIGI
jgi:hypothetical protein